MIIQTGKWRPLQGPFHVYSIYVGARGLLAGPVPGQAISDVVGGHNLLSYLFYISLFLGGVIAISGEIYQLKANRKGCIEKYNDALYLESAGTILLSLNFAALAVAIYFANIQPTPIIVIYICLAIGFMGRTLQALYDSKRIRAGIRKAGENLGVV